LIYAVIVTWLMHREHRSLHDLFRARRAEPATVAG
jgi:hypothetical protein